MSVTGRLGNFPVNLIWYFPFLPLKLACQSVFILAIPFVSGMYFWIQFSKTDPGDIFFSTLLIPGFHFDYFFLVWIQQNLS